METQELKIVKKIERKDTLDWLLNIHYAKRVPLIRYSFGLFINNILKGVITYGNPPSQNVCKCVCGDSYKQEVLELNRLVLIENKKNYASFLVGNSLKLLPKPSIVVSYADINYNHHGYIYQATNFIYTGKAKGREKFIDKNGKDINERTLSSQYQKLKISRSDYMKLHNITLTKQLPKYRYVYIVGNKKQKKERLKNFKLKILPYPKGDNKNYIWQYETKQLIQQGKLF
jgi:hypothetical protein